MSNKKEFLRKRSIPALVYFHHLTSERACRLCLSLGNDALLVPPVIIKLTKRREGENEAREIRGEVIGEGEIGRGEFERICFSLI